MNYPLPSLKPLFGVFTSGNPRSVAIALLVILLLLIIPKVTKKSSERYVDYVTPVFNLELTGILIVLCKGTNIQASEIDPVTMANNERTNKAISRVAPSQTHDQFSPLIGL
ncbi:hypothetical protein CEXT_420481 [Caerostris extrusa]|uniref:Uncharacterized protein n=1 Tax=Caerostris extrusa TaxID=172846 RepID=A0AAV4X4W9_CAEEX|nr:hypothetical protein CEXT_420481 [Caerostris extrusa]